MREEVDNLVIMVFLHLELLFVICVVGKFISGFFLNTYGWNVQVHFVLLEISNLVQYIIQL